MRPIYGLGKGTASARVASQRVLKEKGSIDEEERGTTTKKKNSNMATDQCPDGPAKPGLVKSEIPIRIEKGRTKEFAQKGKGCPCILI